MTPPAYHRPNFTPEDAIRFASIHYHLKVHAVELPSQIDQNFLLETSHGERFVLKIAHAEEDWNNLDLQNQMMAHLSQSLPELSCPNAVAVNTGDKITSVKDASGQSFYMRLLTYVDGALFSDFRPHDEHLLTSLGYTLGEIDLALSDFEHPNKQDDLRWNLLNAPDIVRDHIAYITDSEQSRLIQIYWQYYEREVLPRTAHLRTSFIYNDASDTNILVQPHGLGESYAVGVIDFGDCGYSYVVAELAIALAYAMQGKSDPIDRVLPIVQGYHAANPLTDVELEVLYGLVLMRLCVSVTIAAYQKHLMPDNAHITVNEDGIWSLLEKLRDIHPSFAHYQFRAACGLEAVPKATWVQDWLRMNQASFASIVNADLHNDRVPVFDFGLGSPLLAMVDDASDPQVLESVVQDVLNSYDASFGLGQYGEVRQIYTEELFVTDANSLAERRNVHLGIDLFCDPDTPVFAPLDGIVYRVYDNEGPQNYGPTIILEHSFEDGEIHFFTLYGHLNPTSLTNVVKGQQIAKGEAFAAVGTYPINGNWPPHLHFQIVLDMLAYETEFPGVGRYSQWDVWSSLSPDPNLILGIPREKISIPQMTQDEILFYRQQNISSVFSVSYHEPLHIVRGSMQYLYAANGRKYLDCVNNVSHVGHNHPRVVKAAQRQIAILNTNTRYLHANLIEYAQRLTATLPESLSVCFFVNSGTEANDLALRIAQTVTGNEDVLVLDHAYHGHSKSIIEISPYKFNGAGGHGKPEHVHITPLPDVYRGQHKANDPLAGPKYARWADEILQQAHHRGQRIAAFFAESLPGCGGQIVLPDRYLSTVYDYVRDVGGLCVADEVQVGFGRVGQRFWGFELQGVVPDIVTMGKPIGNGHPLAAVVTTPEIAAAFSNGMEYFNTFGGNPVSGAIGLEVLNVIEDENLQEHAKQVGSYLQGRLQGLMEQFPLIGDVRGRGLFMGVELVLDRKTQEPAPAQTSYVVERMRHEGILLSTEGPFHNVLKIKPPLAFDQENADLLVDTLAQILAEDVLQVESP